MDSHTNFAYSTVLTAPSPGASGTSLVLQSGDGTKFPTPPFNATVWPAQGIPLQSNAEIVRVTNKSTDTLTISRSQESTSARTIGVGDQIAATITVKTITDIENSAVMEDSVQVAATRVVQNMLVAGDAQPAFSILGDGTMQWGLGSVTPPDTKLYRQGVGILQTDGAFYTGDTIRVARAGAGAAVQSKYANDAQMRWNVDAAGAISWGNGSVVTDTTISRYSANMLQGGASGQGFRFHLPWAQAATDIQHSGQVQGDSYTRWSLRADGRFDFGPGNAPTDTALYRIGVQTLEIDNLLRIGSTAQFDSTKGAGRIDLGYTAQSFRFHAPFGQAATDIIVSTQLEADTLNRFRIQYDGKLLWGAGSVTQPDTNLYRASGAAVLVTDQPFRVNNVGGVNVIAGSTAVLREYAVVTDANPRVQLLTDRLQFGPGGATALDTQILRTAASTMQMNGTFIVGGLNAVPASAGAAIRAFVTGDTQNRVQINADAGGGAIYMGSGSVTPVKVLGTRITGWAAWTGTANRATKATSTATVADCAGTLMALIADLTTHGIIGP